jgi:hypothetical protein
MQEQSARLDELMRRFRLAHAAPTPGLSARRPTPALSAD